MVVVKIETIGRWSERRGVGRDIEWRWTCAKRRITQMKEAPPRSKSEEEEEAGRGDTTAATRRGVRSPAHALGGPPLLLASALSAVIHLLNSRPDGAVRMSFLPVC